LVLDTLFTKRCRFRNTHQFYHRL